MELSILYFIPLIALLAVIALKDFKNGLYVVLATAPLYLARVKIFGIPSTWLELAIYTLAVVFVCTHVVPVMLNKRAGNAYMRSLRMRFSNICFVQIFFIALFFLGAICSAFIAPDKRAAFGMLKGWFFDPVLFFVLFIKTMKSARDIFRAIFSLSLGILALSFYGFWEFANKQFLNDAQRLDSVFESPNYFTMYAVPILILALGTFAYVFLVAKKFSWREMFLNDKGGEFSLQRGLSGRSKGKVLRLCNYFFTQEGREVFAVALSVCAGLGAVYLTTSYGGWGALVLGSACLWFFLPRSKTKYALCVLGIAVLAPIFFLTYQRTGFRHVDAFWKEKTDSASARVIIWRGAGHLLKEHPFLGIGLGGFRVKYKEYSMGLDVPPIERSVILPHNLYLNLWLETGLIGLIGFLGMVAVFVFKSVKNFLKTKNYALILPLAALAALLAHGMIDTPYFKNDLSLLFWVILGMMVVLEREQLSQ